MMSKNMHSGSTKRLTGKTDIYLKVSNINKHA